MRPSAMLAAVGGLTTKQIVTAESTHWQAGSAEEDEACATPEPQATSTPEWPARATDTVPGRKRTYRMFALLLARPPFPHPPLPQKLF